MKRSLLRSSLLKRKASIRRVGQKTKEWKEFRDLKAKRDRDEEGLLYCQDYKIGLPKCGYGLPSMDLHHIEGRDGKLMFDESKMVWLRRACHDASHNKRSGTFSEK